MVKFKLFGFEVTLAREDDAYENPYGWWECEACGERGRWPHETEDMIWRPSGKYDWRNYSEMRCECRRHHEEAGKCR